MSTYLLTTKQFYENVWPVTFFPSYNIVIHLEDLQIFEKNHVQTQDWKSFESLDDDTINKNLC